MKKQNPTHHLCVRAFSTFAVALITITNVRADYKSTVLGDNPLAYYALNPASDPAGVSPDLTANGNNGTAYNINPAAGPTAYLTNSASFDPGSLSHIDLSTGANPALLQFNGPTTLEAWVQPALPEPGLGDIIAKGYDAADNYHEIALRENSSGAQYFGYFGGPGVSGGQQSTNWAYVVLANDGVNTRLYINGSLIQSASDTTGSINFANTVPWAIGSGTADGASRFFNGNICQVAIYNYGLTSSQVLAHYYYGEVNADPSTSAPIIVTQPQPQATYLGGSATFSVSAVSAFAMTNQWLKNGTPLAGKTNTTLTLNNVQAGDATNYSVIVGNINGTTNSAVAALSLFTPSSLRWSASGNSGVWDTSSSANWINVSSSSQTVFNTGDFVLFDDSVGAPTSVTVSGTVVPSLITVNSSANNFTIGSGTITGSGGLVKQGSSTLTIFDAGTLTGPVTISGGSIYAGNNTFNSVSSITITNNATLDLAGGTFNGNKPITVSGAGVNGKGAIFNSYDDYPQESVNITLAGDTVFGGFSRWDLASGSQINGAHNLTLDWSAHANNNNDGNPYSEWNSPIIGANVTGIALATGSKLGIKNMDTSFQNPGTVFTVGINGQAIFWSGGWNGSFHVLNGAQVYLWTAPAPINGSNVILEESANWMSWGNSSTDEPINSAVTLNGVAHFVIGDHNLVYTNLISGVGGFVADAWNHQFVFSASNTYSGPTILADGPQVALTGNGSISHSALIFFGGNNPNSVHFDVTGRSDQTLTLASGQTLQGIGQISGKLTVSAGATLSPAGTNTTIGITAGQNAIGTVSATGDITLAGTTVIKLNGPGTNDAVTSTTGSITCGGTLNLVNINATPLAAGDSFQILNAGTIFGSFANITPVAPGAGLAWSISQLSTTGVISVVARPVISSTVVSGGNLIFSGTNGTAGNTYYVLASTNLIVPLSAWTRLQTNTFGPGGVFSVTNAIDPATPNRFFMLNLQ